MEMMEWWFVERDLLDKMFNIIVPRFATAQEPFTSLYLLPRIRALCYAHKKARKWSSFDVGVLELNGWSIFTPFTTSPFFKYYTYFLEIC